MSIATKSGDDGSTGLFGGDRVRKCNLRVSAYGEIDETNSVVGLARAEGVLPEVDPVLERIQVDLFDLGAELATRREGNPHAHLVPVFDERPVGALDSALSTFEPAVPRMDTFILPGGSRTGAWLHLARTVARRAERTLVALAGSEDVPAPALHYMNRLSDLLFILARYENMKRGAPETKWTPRRETS